MKSTLLPFSTISICVLLSLSDNEVCLISFSLYQKYRQSVYSILLNELQLEYEQTYYSWRYSLLSSIPQDSKYKPISKLLQDIIDIVNAGYIEGIELLLHFYDYLLHYNGKWDSINNSSFFIHQIQKESGFIHILEVILFLYLIKFLLHVNLLCL